MDAAVLKRTPSAAATTAVLSRLRAQTLQPEWVAAWKSSLDLTPMQWAAVDEFRTRVQETGLLSERTESLPELWKWVQARKYHVNKAFAMFEAHHREMRPRFGIDVCVETPIGSVPRSLAEMDMSAACMSLFRAIPQAFHKVDKRGRPVFINRIGKANIEELRQYRQQTTLEERLAAQVWQMERTIEYRLPTCSTQAGKLITNQLSIIDMDGFSLRLLDSELRASMKVIAKLHSDNYPELLGQAFVVNAPRFFTIVFSIVKHVLDPATVAKIQVYGTDQQEWLPKLLEVVDASNLPTFLGGEDTSWDPINSGEQGPWMDLLKEAGASCGAQPLVSCVETCV